MRPANHTSADARAAGRLRARLPPCRAPSLASGLLATTRHRPGRDHLHRRSRYRRLPAYVPDDHTAFAIKWSATGGTLTPGTQYYVKMRLNTSGRHRRLGDPRLDLDGASRQWVQERDDWTKFPVVTADAPGNVASTWMGCKFGDDTKSGTYYVIVSLTPLPYASRSDAQRHRHAGGHRHDMASGGYWVHNGVATGAQATKRAEATDHADGTKVWALSRTETNLVDDDSNGTADDEDHGPAGKTGDFRFALPHLLVLRRLPQSRRLDGRAERQRLARRRRHRPRRHRRHGARAVSRPGRRAEERRRRPDVVRCGRRRRRSPPTTSTAGPTRHPDRRRHLLHAAPSEGGDRHRNHLVRLRDSRTTLRTPTRSGRLMRPGTWDRLRRP